MKIEYLDASKFGNGADALLEERISASRLP
jgi:hypothetical protein